MRSHLLLLLQTIFLFALFVSVFWAVYRVRKLSRIQGKEESEKRLFVGTVVNRLRNRASTGWLLLGTVLGVGVANLLAH